eukprot:15451794-Alexandrium_andersonii.AAC.1
MGPVRIADCTSGTLPCKDASSALRTLARASGSLSRAMLAPPHVHQALAASAEPLCPDHSNDPSSNDVDTMTVGGIHAR